MVNETGASSAKFLREAANRKGPDEEARARAERGRAKNAALAASNDVQQLSSELVSSQLCSLLHIFFFFSWATFSSSTTPKPSMAWHPNSFGCNSFGWPGARA